MAKKKPAKKTKPKKKNSKHTEKFFIKGSLDEVLKASVKDK